MSAPATGLTGLRVLDLAGAPGIYGSKLLADLGADVVRIEPPSGDPLRQVGPFFRDQPGPGHSLSFAYYNTSKRSIELDLEQESGRDQFRRLAAVADIVHEAEPPGAMARLGIGYTDVVGSNPGLIWTSVTPFGQEGPRAGWKANDLVAMAAGGVLYLNGFPGKRPLQAPLEQAYNLGGVAAVTGSLIALNHRARTGRGQFVDVSLQAAVATATENTLGFWDVNGVIRMRLGARGFQGHEQLHRCKDGWVVGFYGNRWENVLSWAEEVGIANDEWRDPRWFDRNERESNVDMVNQMVNELLAVQTMAEIEKKARERRIAIQPANRIPDLLTDPQLAFRGYWTAVPHDDLGTTLTYPGAPFQSSSGFWRMRSRAPRPGEHTEEVLAEWGRAAPVETVLDTEQSAGAPPVPPLAGIRIVDFTQSVTGPLATRTLADHGAEVIKIEWGRRPDGIRLMIVPRPTGNRSVNVSATWNNFNSSKRDITLNLNLPAARDFVRRLISIADIVVDNYGVDPMPKWGFSYDEVRAIRPDVIMARSSVMGRSGPKNGTVGFGYGIAAVSGWNSLMGFPDEPPLGMGPAYPDTTANCHHFLVAILTALEHRRRTGQGQYIDLAQFESTISWLGPAILDYTVNGRVQQPSANRHPDYSPHGVYPTAGEDRWIAIAVNNESWEAFKQVAASAGLDDPRFETHAGRKEAEDDLDVRIGGWTATLDGRDLAARLQAANVAAAALANGEDLIEDPQLAHRGHYVQIEHPEAGLRRWERYAFSLTGTPGTPHRSPLLGEHNDWAFAELLGLDEEQVAAAYVDGVIE